eukprot:CAMPEP_0181470586 /NCGR_PEP_ID=MMETSP1110-20121109/38630_1 /TAXON_ID=174948 /ORGANISM="Symbiodinium sp., Strain CCMP421" /LENGTH=115 /DNA_ID=CAMNT_0023595567 /DNA_START=42 /DNA_END=389 /DNA_ORIENTATION=+
MDACATLKEAFRALAPLQAPRSPDLVWPEVFREVLTQLLQGPEAMYWEHGLGAEMVTVCRGSEANRVPEPACLEPARPEPQEANEEWQLCHSEGSSGELEWTLLSEDVEPAVTVS